MNRHQKGLAIQDKIIKPSAITAKIIVRGPLVNMLMNGRCKKPIRDTLNIYDTATINRGNENRVARINGHKGFSIAAPGCLSFSSAFIAMYGKRMG